MQLGTEHDELASDPNIALPELGVTGKRRAVNHPRNSPRAVAGASFSVPERESCEMVTCFSRVNSESRVLHKKKHAPISLRPCRHVLERCDRRLQVPWLWRCVPDLQDMLA